MIRLYRVFPDISRLPAWVVLMRIAVGRWPSGYLFEYAEELKTQYGGTIVTSESEEISASVSNVLIFVDAPTGWRRSSIAQRLILELQQARKRGVTWLLVTDGDADVEKNVVADADEIINIRQENGKYEQFSVGEEKP